MEEKINKYLFHFLFKYFKKRIEIEGEAVL